MPRPQAKQPKTEAIAHIPRAVPIRAQQTSDPTPMTLIRLAMEQKDFDVAKLTKLYELHERNEANLARRAYYQALADFKSNPPLIRKNKHVRIQHKSGDGTTEYDHATLDEVCDAIVPALAEHGLAHRWKTEQDKSVIKVTCILRHKDGYEESNTIEGLADTTGSKNPLQAINSAITYLERYTLLAVTGMAARGQDDDGKAAGKPVKSVEEGTVPPKNGNGTKGIKRDPEPNRGHGAEGTQEAVTPKEKERLTRVGLQELLDETLQNIWPRRDEAEYRAIAGKVVFACETKNQLTALPIERFALGVYALKHFEHHRKIGQPMPIRREALEAELEQCLQLARDEMAEQKLRV